MYCSKCGQQVDNSANFCVHCGCAVKNENRNNFSSTYPYMQNQQNFAQDDYKNTINKLSNYEKTSGVIWLTIGIIQCITLVGIICGIWNIVISIQRLNYSKIILTSKPIEIYNNFENQLTSIIVFLIINIFFGAVIGIVGALFDLFVRNFAMENKNVFLNKVSESLQKGE